MSSTREQINRYLHQQMDEEERKAFEQSLARDTALQQQLKEETEQLETDFVDWLSEEAIRKDIQDISKEMEEEKLDTPTPVLKPVRGTGSSFRLPSIVKYAAAVALLLLTATFLYRSLLPQEVSTLAISQQYYQEYKPAFATAIKGNSISPNDPFSQMTALLDSESPKDQATAATYFNTIPSTDENYPLAQYYLAHSFFLQKEAPKATQAFQQFIANNPKHPQKAFAEFYLILSLLAQEQEATALQKIDLLLADQSHPFHRLAGELKGELIR